MPEDLSSVWSGQCCLRSYHPYRLGGCLNPAFVPALDGRLLNFKDGDACAIRCEAEDVRRALSAIPLDRPTWLGVIPGHEARSSNRDTPLARLVQAVAGDDARLLAHIDALLRVTTVLKRATGGARSINANCATMAVTDAATIAGKAVIVLDDTVTTGNSIAAARRLLLEAGALRVGAMALARTAKYF